MPLLEPRWQPPMGIFRSKAERKFDADIFTFLTHHTARWCEAHPERKHMLIEAMGAVCFELYARTEGNSALVTDEMVAKEFENPANWPEPDWESL